MQCTTVQDVAQAKSRQLGIVRGENNKLSFPPAAAAAASCPKKANNCHF